MPSTPQKELDKRVTAEKAAHDDNDVLAESYKLKNRFKHIWVYPSRKEFDTLFHENLKNISGLSILDYGCGLGNQSISYLRDGALVTGIDISEKYIEKCNHLAERHNLPIETYNFFVMDAHHLEFPDNSFDIVAGNGILHHLDPCIAMKEIHRVLKPGGRVLLQEPLADNPLLKLFRVLTPFARTEDEMPFSKADLATIINSDIWQSQSFYCGIIEAPIAMITSLIIPSKPDNVFLRLAHRIEKAFLKRSLLLSWNQYVLLNLVKK